MIYPRDSFAHLWEKQALNLCEAAKENKKIQAIQCLDEGIIPADASPVQLRGWTALHYACKFGHFEMALFLIYHAANLYKQNDAKKLR